MPVSGSSFVTRAGFVLDPDERIVIHATDEDEATERLEPIELGELERLVEAESVQVVDVREKSEREAGYIPCSGHIPVIHGGIDDWPGQLVAFRRCGGSG